MHQYVVVEGLIGVGKSSLCRLLAREWNAQLVMEPDVTNPFLESFYRDPDRFAFPVQMYYLIMRWRQQQDIRQMDLFQRPVVSDYLFAKDRLFAEKTLEETELGLYDHFASALGQQTPAPDLLVYLHAPIDVVMGRIKKRAAPGEEVIARAYIEDLAARYDALLEKWTACPVLRIDNRDMDYVQDPSARQQVLALIHNALQGKIAGYAPGSSDREAQPDLFGTR